MSSPRREIRVNSPSVASETIGGEAIILNLNSGLYYVTNPCGGLIWTWVEAGTTFDAIVASLAQLYDAGGPEMACAVQAFLDALLREELIVLCGEPPAASAPPAPLALQAARQTFEPPAFTRYSDMAEMLLLDSVHEIEHRGKQLG